MWSTQISSSGVDGGVRAPLCKSGPRTPPVCHTHRTVISGAFSLCAQGRRRQLIKLLPREVAYPLRYVELAGKQSALCAFSGNFMPERVVHLLKLRNMYHM